MNKYANELAALIIKNPDVEVVPMVDSEICRSDEYGYWTGSIGRSRLDEYVIYEDRIWTRQDQEELEELLTDNYFIEYGDNPELAHKRAEGMKWKKAIIVDIDLPEQEEEP